MSLSQSPSWKRIVLLQRSQEAERTIPIHEIFDTVAGEGPTAGLPSIFVRVAGCTRTCKWCDTGYTDSASAALSKIPHIRMSVDSIIKCLCLDFPIRDRHIVFTGGEPLPYLADFLRVARETGSAGVSMETNGERLNGHFDYALWKDIQFVISPKLSSSGKKSPVACYGEMPNVFYKFVIADMQDIEDMLAWTKHKFHNDVYIQPVYGSDEAINVVGNFLSNVRSSFKPTQKVKSNDMFGDPYTLEGTTDMQVPRFRLSIQMHKILGLA